MKSWKLMFAASLASVLGASGAVAQTASQMSEVTGASGGLGSSHRFPSQQAAALHCPGDVVVWGSGTKLRYWLPGTPGYGHNTGFYACKMEADGAGFHPAA